MNLTIHEKEFALSKEQHLIKRLKELGRVVVAFSGGVDSTYLMAVAQETLGEDALAVFAKGAMVAESEIQEVCEISGHLNFLLNMIPVDILELDGFTSNRPDRCYHCKKHIFTHLLDYAKAQNIMTVIEGTNQSDESDFRPGRRALNELGIVSPLQQAGLSKEEIRLLSQRRGLPTWNKPSMACLASRVPYGDKITSALLLRIAEGEKILAGAGFAERRLRVHGDIARIEIPPRKFPLMLEKYAGIAAGLMDLGFRFVTLDLNGLRSGSLNPPGGSHA